MIEFIAADREKIIYQIGVNFKTIKTIDPDSFYRWLKWSDRLHYVFDSVDHTGDHKQTDGEFTYEGYFENNSRIQIEEDILDYLGHLKSKV